MKVFLIIILSFLLLLYIPLNRQKPKYRFKIQVDDHIPLVPWTVWIYTSYYLLLPLSIIVSWNTALSSRFLLTQIVTTSLAVLIWWLFPNGVARPQIKNYSKTHHYLLDLIYHHDQDCNGLPSGHVAHSFVSCYFLAQLFPNLWLAFLSLLFAISLSTLTTKQHYYLDVVTTLLVMPLIINLSSRLF